jgi:LysR family transcriptional regulator, benzoate and cis,cis-muconate-responsive activator of ben and cat genes
MNLELIERRHLRSFLALADHLNFHQAAEELHITQPALSKQIALMEDALGRKLFSREKKRVQLTPSGRYLQRQAPGLLVAFMTLLKETGEAGEGQRGSLAMGYTEAAMASFLPSLLRKIRQRMSGISLHLSQEHSEYLAREVMRGRLDLAFISLPTELSGLKSTLVAQERMGIVLPDDHPLAGEREVSLKHLARERFILFAYEDNPKLYSDILSWCRGAGFVPQLTDEASTRILAVNQVAAGLGVTFLSEHLSHYCGEGTVFRMLKPTVKMQFYLVESENLSNPAVQELKMLVKGKNP